MKKAAGTHGRRTTIGMSSLGGKNVAIIDPNFRMNGVTFETIHGFSVIFDNNRDFGGNDGWPRRRG